MSDRQTELKLGEVFPERKRRHNVSVANAASAAAIVLAVAASFAILLDLVFTGHVIEIDAELVATFAILGACGAIYAWLEARRHIASLRNAEFDLAAARDQAEQANLAKSMFLATMSHEIRTPMNGVLGMLRLLKDTQLTPEQQAYAKSAHQSGEALLSLIDEILDFSKIEAGRLDLEPAPFDLVRMVEDVTELLAPKAHSKDISVACHVDPALGHDYIGDEPRIRQILLNLAGNAVKFTDQGGVSIRVERDPTRQRDGWDTILFRIADTGIGMRSEELERIFDEFRQADSTPSRRYGGTGLGLAITRRLVERMSGEVTVRSVPGKGSEFQVRLLLERTAGAQSTDTARVLAGLSVHCAGIDQVTETTISSYAGEYGATVEMTPGPGAMLDLLRNTEEAGHYPGIIIIDTAVGLDTALEFPRALADEISPDHPCRTLVLLEPEQRQSLPELRDAGFNGYLIKPVRRSSLIEQLTTLSSPGDRKDPDEETDGAAPDPFEASYVKPLQILLAEDNDVNALLACALLERAGHDVCHVANGRQAVEALAGAADEQSFDVVLMDMHMPEMDGLEATRLIRASEKNAGGRRVPIVALTANAFEEDREACIAAGMDDYLSKPVEPEVLNGILARISSHCDG